MNILGINAYHGNASAAVVCDGRLVAAVEEERFNRIKYAAGFPAQAIRYCLKEAGLKLEGIHHVAGARKTHVRAGTKIFFTPRPPALLPGTAQGAGEVLRRCRGVGGAVFPAP